MVSLTKKSEEQLKTSYSLEELRDLESKLVLIAGNRPEHRQEVDFFVNVRIKVTVKCFYE